ncbi:FAD-binding domain-containing protein [Novosphingobium piscinae]|uniref:Deoxyribodipyrimidine photolyase n=1 Tax=Novosphingobium piscinae TaxID=1507448 RepID=A0A7X1KRG6_9SPHN|nr:FAD-binding domain-containing protein [Novosphingobium piscinae]MBC2670737.1 deoxyribodipyrimidine photolyase [Novosphingobium piscinae]
MTTAPAPAFPLTRAAALARLETFLPLAGVAYARDRNRVARAGQHHAVSRLSAALRRRVVSEAEVVAAVLAVHGPDAAASFISEVFWRTYWKGWLEARPAVWHAYRAAATRAPRAPLAAALAGTTGIHAFDAWHAELVETGWLHNWARMQFASIWVHTLGLDWAAGAAFMAGHLIDADPASNTLSWRWVAGLHTAGKAYLADGARIAAMTGGRLGAAGLATGPRIPAADPLPAPAAPRPPRPWLAGRPSVLLLTPEDLSPETAAPDGLAVTAVLAPQALFPTQADRVAGDDALARAAEHWGCVAEWVPDLSAVAARAEAQIVTPFAPVGPVALALEAFAAGLPPGCTLGEWQRGWDRAAWPHCRKGYFALRQAIPTLIAGL